MKPSMVHQVLTNFIFQDLYQYQVKMENNGIKEQLQKVLTHEVQPKNANFQQATSQIIKRFKQNHFNELIYALLDIVKTNSSLSLRRQCIRQLKTCLFESQSSDPKNFNVLSKSHKEHVLLSLTLTLQKEQDAQIKRITSELLIKAAVIQLPSHIDIFSRFTNSLQNIMTDQTTKGNTDLSLALITMIKSCPAYFRIINCKAICLFFEYVLNHSNPEIKLQAFHSFSAFILALQDNQESGYQELASLVYLAVYRTITQQPNNDIISIFLTVIKNMPQIFLRMRQEEQLKNTINIFYSANLAAADRRQFIQTMVQLIYDTVVLDSSKDSKKWMKAIIDMIFFYMASISEEISKQWFEAERQYSVLVDKDEDSSITCSCITMFSKLIKCISRDGFSFFLELACQRLLKATDWRHKYSALMALSLIEDKTKIQQILRTILTYMADENTKVRYAACHAIGTISYDMNPVLRNAYGSVLVSHLHSVLLNDPAPIVVTHSLAALTNLLQRIKYENLSSQIYTLMISLQHYAQNGTRFQKCTAVATICSLVEISKEKFHLYLDRTLQIFFQYFQTEIGMTQIQQQAIHTIREIIINVEPEQFRPFLNNFIFIMVNFQKSLSIEMKKAKDIIFQAWKSIFELEFSQLSILLQDIHQQLFAFIKKSLKYIVGFFMINEDYENNSDLSPVAVCQQKDEDKTDLVEMLQTYIDKFPLIFKNQATQIADLLLAIIKNNCQSTLSEKFYMTLRKLVAKIKDDSFSITFARHLLEQILENSQNIELLIMMLKLFVQVLDNCAMIFLSQTEISKLIELSMQSLQIDPDIIEENQSFALLHTCYIEILEVVLKTHKTLMIPLLPHLVTRIIPSLFSDNQRKMKVYFGLKLLCDLILHFDYQDLCEFQQSITSILLTYLQKRGLTQLHLACIGIGNLVEKIPPHRLNPQTGLIWLTVVKNSFRVPRRHTSFANYARYKDNIISAIGKIIKAYADLMDLTEYVDLWVDQLPLRYDLIQGKVQHEIFIDFMLDKPELILGNDKLRNLEKVMIIIGEIVKNEEFYNNEIMLKINHYFQKVKACEEDYKTALGIWRGLHSITVKKNLANFLI